MPRRGPAAIVLLLVATSLGACTIYHCHPPDPDAYARPPTDSTPVRYRTLPLGEGRDGGSLAVYTRTTEYRPAAGVAVDFAREEVVHLVAPQNGTLRLAWVAETPDELLVGVETATQCTAYPPPPEPPVEIAIPLSTKPVRVVGRDVGPPCDLGGRG